MAPARGVTILLWALSIKLAAALAFLAAASAHPALPGYTAAREPGTPEVAWHLARGFDSNAYQRMAREGFYDDFSICMGPGYPLLIRAVLPLTGSAQTAALVVANACALAALGVFLALARRLAGAATERVAPAVLLFACLPGLLAFGTVAYSEAPWILCTLLAWWAYLRAEGRAEDRADMRTAGQVRTAGRADPPPGMQDDGTALVAAGDAASQPRSLAWLLLAALFATLSIVMRHASVAFLAGLLLVEALRVRSAAAGAPRRRALFEAACFGALAALPATAFLLFKFLVQDMGTIQRELFDSRFVPLGVVPALLGPDVPPENAAVLLLSVPLALALLVRLWNVDRRIALVTGCQVLLALSVTGIAAQSINRLLWAIAPLALGALAVRDRVLLGGVAGVLFLVSLWCGIGHVLGTAAL